MMKTFSALIAAVALATPALAETMVHDGKIYNYTVEQRGKVQVITGEETTERRAFTLKVKNGWVDGEVDGSPVSFSTREVVRYKLKAAAAEVAAR